MNKGHKASTSPDDSGPHLTVWDKTPMDPYAPDQRGLEPWWIEVDTQAWGKPESPQHKHLQEGVGRGPSPQFGGKSCS